jgi:hypothetical protein
MTQLLCASRWAIFFLYYLYVDSFTYAFGWSAFLCRIRFCDSPRCHLFKVNIIIIIVMMMMMIMMFTYQKYYNLAVGYKIYICTIHSYIYIHMYVFQADGFGAVITGYENIYMKCDG